MEIDEKMLDAALAVNPQIDRTILKKMFAAALAGQILVVDGAGEFQTGRVGKSDFPDYVVVRVSSVYTALSLAQQLISAVQHEPTQQILERPVDLLFAGVAVISREE